MTETPEFRAWHRLTTALLLGGKSVEEQVEDAMRPENLKIEARNERGQWQEISCDELERR